jgi:predicted transcriptional regulator
MTKDSGFRIRVQRELREKFLEICREQDKPAAQVLREYMRDYVAEHDAANDPMSAAKKVTDTGGVKTEVKK